MTELDEDPSMELPSPSVDVRDLHSITPAEAMALVDQHLGSPASWPSALLAYRLQSEWQADWKVEVGNWLHTAKSHGFLDAILRQIEGERGRRGEPTVIKGNDKHHLKLHQYLAPALACHYFTRTGWSFVGFETETGGKIDVDLALDAPDGSLVEFQVKAPDQPGEVNGGRIHDGEYDERIVAALDKAAAQLPLPARSVGMVFIHAQRGMLLVGDCGCLVHHLIGTTSGAYGVDGVFLQREDRGKFFSNDWEHVAGVVAVDLVRGLDRASYACTVLLNPQATHPAHADWFPRGRVAVLDGDRFQWIRGEPGDLHTLPSGTQVVDRIPGF